MLGLGMPEWHVTALLELQHIISKVEARKGCLCDHDLLSRQYLTACDGKLRSMGRPPEGRRARSKSRAWPVEVMNPSDTRRTSAEIKEFIRQSVGLHLAYILVEVPERRYVPLGIPKPSIASRCADSGMST